MVREDAAKEDNPVLVYGVPVRNAFDILKESAAAKSGSSATEVLQVPPIVISQSPEKAKNRIAKFAGNFNIKYTKEGATVFARNRKTYDEIKTALGSDGLNSFHSFQPKDQRVKRFVLYGLCQYPDGALLPFLNKAKLNPIDVRPMRIKAPRFKGQCNYVLYFSPHDGVTLNGLRSVKSIDDTTVSWAYYKIKEPGTRPCRKCCRFGHGKSSCGHTPRCIICAKGHLMEDCPLLKAKREGGHTSIHSSLLRCANCNQNHTATYEECTTRIKFMEQLEEKKSTKKNDPRNLTDPLSFPPLPAKPQGITQQVQTSHTSPPTLKFTDITQPPPQSTKEDLFDADELQDMLNTFYNNLQKCNSKVEQAKVIADYGIKYFAKFK